MEAPNPATAGTSPILIGSPLGALFVGSGSAAEHEVSVARQTSAAIGTMSSFFTQTFFVEGEVMPNFRLVESTPLWDTMGADVKSEINQLFVCYHAS